ncbi:SigE family RNA polymerase sigma factor [Blastococcus sp. LR1]|uniref:SigE family RNA polymerase sigma factor n=1 Tax=Blastococcus sp. LR1 TaxID=2877000 RepID=UPI001CCE0B0E|nr:SigE family RNA polymerase sigma factor [Blastococcus sp. LR1]MCA0144998.1 SigE family RNA polymerase sigma factor [Blastococcus sp. LR1]
MAQRDDGEFTEFVEQHSPGLLRTACLLTGDRHRGEDLVQTALARAYAQWPKVRGAENRPAYVRRLMVNSHLSWLRRLSSTESVIESLPERVDGADLQSRHAEADELRTALAHLSPRMRTAVVLRYFDDLSEAETARLMSCSTSTVNNHVTRGLAVLRTVLKPAPAPEASS